ncbi:hypothetical protein [Pseudomonas gingeri]
MALPSTPFDLLQLGDDAPSNRFLFCLSPMQQGALLQIPYPERLSLTLSMVDVYRSRWTDESQIQQVLAKADAALASGQVNDVLHGALRNFIEHKRFPDLPYEGKAELTLTYAAEGAISGSETFHDVELRIVDTDLPVQFVVVLDEPLPGQVVRSKLYHARLVMPDHTALLGHITECLESMTAFVMREEPRE